MLTQADTCLSRDWGMLRSPVHCTMLDATTTGRFSPGLEEERKHLPSNFRKGFQKKLTTVCRLSRCADTQLQTKGRERSSTVCIRRTPSGLRGSQARLVLLPNLSSRGPEQPAPESTHHSDHSAPIKHCQWHTTDRTKTDHQRLGNLVQP